jgi:acyl-CoA-binding protein
MSEEFIKTAGLVKALVLDPGTQLQLYGLYKQATQGDNLLEKPTEGVALAKHTAWASQRGKTTEQAEAEYIALVRSFDSSGWGMGVSRPLLEEEPSQPPLSAAEEAVQALCESVKIGSLDCEALSRLGANCQDRQGLTPLHHAVDEAQTALVQQLLALGASPNVQDLEGMTPLHYAAELDYADILQLLLSAPGADPSLRDNDGNSIFAIAQGKCASLL